MTNTPGIDSGEYVSYCSGTMTDLKDFADLIGSWPTQGKRSSIRAFSEDTGIAYLNACMMKQRNSIAPEHWPAVIDAARKRNLNYTTDSLVEMTQRAKRKRVRGKRRAAECVAA